MRKGFDYGETSRPTCLTRDCANVKMVAVPGCPCACAVGDRDRALKLPSRGAVMGKPPGPDRCRKRSTTLEDANRDRTVDDGPSALVARTAPYPGIPDYLGRHVGACHRRRDRDVQRRQHGPPAATSLPACGSAGGAFGHRARFRSPGSLRPRLRFLFRIQGELEAPRRDLRLWRRDVDAAHGRPRRAHFHGVPDERHVRHAWRAAHGRATSGSGRRRSGGRDQ